MYLLLLSHEHSEICIQTRLENLLLFCFFCLFFLFICRGVRVCVSLISSTMPFLTHVAHVALSITGLAQLKPSFVAVG